MLSEQARKHGPFDLRYPRVAHAPAPPSLWRAGATRADWLGFSARFYPDGRRHDLAALAAYDAYRNDADR